MQSRPHRPPSTGRARSSQPQPEPQPSRDPAPGCGRPHLTRMAGPGARKMEAGAAAAPHCTAPSRPPPLSPRAKLTTHRRSRSALPLPPLPSRPGAKKPPLALLQLLPPPPPQAQRSLARDAASAGSTRAARSVTD